MSTCVVGWASCSADQQFIKSHVSTHVYVIVIAGHIVLAAHVSRTDNVHLLFFRYHFHSTTNTLRLPLCQYPCLALQCSVQAPPLKCKSSFVSANCCHQCSIRLFLLLFFLTCIWFVNQSVCHHFPAMNTNGSGSFVSASDL